MCFVQMTLESPRDGESSHTADDGACGDVREPVDDDRHADSHEERVTRAHPGDFPAFWIECDNGRSHRECYRRMRRRPAPEDALFEKTEIKIPARVDV